MESENPLSKASHVLPVQKTLTTHVEWVLLDMTLKHSVPLCKVERIVGASGGLMVVTLRALQQLRVAVA